ncbi:ankyrin repeat domain-containing protein [Aestuariispira insulae]|uniref:Ankyrin repeat protein n=1 Tax=Aestuariispira insulae TaxID=1461337 RepID=A0A3D9HL89_9PROT|nr:ankyrin repeat domain-containing protein [Aestuariispira insulae]RED49666.1 ankyrin repeat protein [Aestuariispira insulae]
MFKLSKCVIVTCVILAETSCVQVSGGKPIKNESVEAVSKLSLELTEKEVSRLEKHSANGCVGLLQRGNINAIFARELDRSLAKAAYDGDLEQVRNLVAQGADVNAVGFKGFSILWFAIGLFNVDVFNAFLEMGANPNTLCDDGTSIVPVLAGWQDSRLLKAALLHGADPDPKLSIHAGKIDTRVKSPFVRSGIPLFDANSMKAVNLLLDAGADINRAHPVSGETLLLIAVRKHQYRKALALLELGADFSIKDLKGIGVADHIISSRAILKSRSRIRKGMAQLEHWLEENGMVIPGSY